MCGSATVLAYSILGCFQKDPELYGSDLNICFYKSLSLQYSTVLSHIRRFADIMQACVHSLLTSLSSLRPNKHTMGKPGRITTKICDNRHIHFRIIYSAPHAEEVLIVAGPCLSSLDGNHKKPIGVYISLFP